MLIRSLIVANKKHSDKKLEAAKRSYMSYEPVSKIARDLNIPRTTIQNHVNEKWKAERQILANEIIAELGETKAAKLSTLFSNGIDVIHAAIKDLHMRGTPPTMNEARAAVNVIEALDKIMRLDQGNPTDIIAETKPISIIELRKEIDELDPFLIGESDDKKDS